MTRATSFGGDWPDFPGRDEAILSGMNRLTWLSEWSADAVRGMLGRAVPGLGEGSIVLDPPVVDTSDPLWAGGIATGGQFVAKFAFSEPTAGRLWREALVLQALGGRPGLRLPEVLAASCDPVFFATRLVDGVPLSHEMISTASQAQADQLGSELAGFLCSLHRPEILACVAAAVGAVSAPDPPPQATTDELRTRLTPMIRPDQADLVQRWCAWTDDVLTRTKDPVFVHGDLHGYNQVWDPGQLRLRLVADFETSGAAEPEFDLRYIPAMGPGVDLLLSTAGHYAHRTGTSLDLGHIMAWHVRSNLGEALWRSEAGLPLLLPIPGGGTPSDYVDKLSTRFDALHIWI
jgi:aminoglycoside phosphotransferase (APT) family kinase protein